MSGRDRCCYQQQRNQAMNNTNNRVSNFILEQKHLKEPRNQKSVGIKHEVKINSLSNRV